jgi:hypothetical protein
VTASRSSVALACADLAAIIVFVTIGLFVHHGGVSASGYARDTLTLGGGWFAAAAIFHPYRSSAQLRRLVATWAVGITAGVLVRALILGRALDSHEGAFLCVCLATIGLFVFLVHATFRVAQPRERVA